MAPASEQARRKQLFANTHFPGPGELMANLCYWHEEMQKELDKFKELQLSTQLSSVGSEFALQNVIAQGMQEGLQKDYEARMGLIAQQQDDVNASRTIASSDANVLRFSSGDRAGEAGV